MTIPTTIYAGDSLDFTYTNPDYSGAGWEIALNFAGPNLFTIVSTTNDSGVFTFEVAATTTNEWLPGTYKCYVTARKDPLKETIGSVKITIEKNPTSINPDTDDLRTHNEKMLEAIQSLLEGKATKDQMSYTIDGVSLSRYSWNELWQMKFRYERLVSADLGDFSDQIIQTRFRNV